MKSSKTGAAKVLKPLLKSDPSYPTVKVIPGPARVPRWVIRRAVHDVLKAHLEKELGRPIKNSEMRRDPKLPPIVSGPYPVRLDPYWARKAAERAAKAKKTKTAKAKR
ncbi:MAG TPA: hypothetical protein VEU62_04000 [Bryobacterales bacterium]|nr:hypothetical protein [Bryobacterales bacterium]